MAEAVTIEAVETTGGRVSGLARAGHQAFYGIPYAKAARFAAPGAPDPWSGVRKAHEIGFAARQTAHFIQGFAASGPQDEDCLNLNVFTPAADDAKRPVLFWIHGGGFTHGAGYEPLYNGGPLAVRGDVVVVSLNYRLGVFGFLHLPEIGVAGNQGLLDQVAALEWVSDNIAAFGGDPDNVTIFGESAGSAAVGCLLAMPTARGLFHRVIMESGVGRASTPDQSDAVADMLLEAVGLTRARAADLHDLSGDAILEAQAQIAGKLPPGGFGPTLAEHSLPITPLQAVRDGRAADRAILIGSNRDEVKLFVASRPRSPLDEAALVAAVRAILPKASEADAAVLIEVYRASRKAKGLPHDSLDIGDAITSDARFRVPAGRLAAAQTAKGGKAFVYFFTHASPAAHGRLGACHALEMPFVFGTLDAPTQDKFAGTGADVERLSAEMMDAWLAFARTGDPNHDAIRPWSTFDTERRATMVFATDRSAEQDDPFGDERRAIEPLV